MIRQWNTVSEHIRQHLLNTLRIKRLNLDSITDQQWCEEFETLRRNRMLMGYFRYPPMKNQKPGEFDTVGSMLKRLKDFIETGNIENLIDVANMCMIEYFVGNHPKKHFESVDDGLHAERIDGLE